MKISYIANVRMPTEKAHGIQIIEMCKAFVQKGAKVELFAPFRFNHIKESPFNYYDLQKSFSIKRLFCLDLLPIEKIIGKSAFYAQVFTFGIRILLQKIKGDYIFCRDALLLPFVLKKKIPVIYEAHFFPKSDIKKWIKYWEKCHRIITITEKLKQEFISAGINEKKIYVFADGVNVEQFQVSLSKGECRKKLDLPLNTKIVLYSGHLYGWKGADVLLESAKELPDVLYIFIGGVEIDINNFKQKAKDIKNVRVLGHKPHNLIPYYLKASDILALPNSGKQKISKFYTSPMKLFEYMTSGNPIIASDLPSIKEVVNEKNAFLFEADNSGDLAKKIKQIFDDYEEAKKRAAIAKEEVFEYDWKKRAKKIMQIL